ncbi:MAG: DUF4019 domain-containing protein [Burkholderiales bacterium]|nr:DUF4019 domain-containing protein [Burkholderiales bacterium]
MLRRRQVLAVLAATSAVGSVAAAPQDEAKAAMERWLALVDTKDYALSWQRAGSPFRSTVSQEQWAKASASVRQSLGEPKQRTLKSAQATNSLPGAPDGQYVVLQFDTSFTNKAAAVETVTAVLEPDGQWRAIGYFIK